MRRILIAFFAGYGLLAASARAADKPVIAPAPGWVKPVTIPPAPTAPGDAPASVLLSDQQLNIKPGDVTAYSDLAIKILKPEGLAAGNVSFSWRPDTDTPIVHKLVIHRGDKTIDVLGSGQTFTVVRREPNLENATLDGVLTANIQPDGLQVGDVLEFALSIKSSDPVLKGHIQELAAAWNGAPIRRAHLHMQWPSSLALRLRPTLGLPAITPVTSAGSTSVDISLDDVQPIPIPKGAPKRYAIGRLVEASDFGSWADVGALMAPLFAKASVVPAQGPLRAEVEKIRRESADPKLRAQAALALVQDRIRYVALVMGQGGLVPADAETTWSRRFGDCKAKTALLLAVLHDLGIQAEPVAVNTVAGDALPERLPMIGLFDHVLVRATIGGRTYWLDGARTGDTSLDRLTTPNYGWGLPLISTGAALVRMLPPPLDAPSQVQTIHIDASAGIFAPAPAHAELELSGDDALAMKLVLENIQGEARESALRGYWRKQYDFIDVKTTSAAFDEKTGKERLSMDGVAHMDWSSGRYETDGMLVGYRADFSRDAGPNQDAPFANAYPVYSKTVESIVMPPNFRIGADILKATDLDRTIAGVAYHRQVTLSGSEITLEKTERSLEPEFPAKDAPAAQAALRALADQDVYLPVPQGYRGTDQDLAALLATTPASGYLYDVRGEMLAARGRAEETIADFGHAIALNPKDVFALANRGLIRVMKGDYSGASADLDAAAALDPKYVVIDRARGLMALRKGDTAGAQAAYTAALAGDPSDDFSRAGLAQAAFEAGDLDAALRDSALLVKAHPQSVEMHLLRSNAFRMQGKTQEALGEAAALAAIPHNSGAQVAAANAYILLGKRDEAMRAFDRALALKPDPSTYLNRAEGRPQTDVAGRRADLDAALALDPNYAPALAAKAALLEHQGDAAGAIADYSRLLQKSPSDPALLTERGIVFAKSGEQGRADADFAAARSHATAPEQLNTLCWLKATEGAALDSALADCNAALAKAPDDPQILDSRGLVLLRLGRLDGAIADYTRALAKAPMQAPSWFGRGVAWSRKGDKAQAAADLAQASKFNPRVRAEFESYGVQP